METTEIEIYKQRNRVLIYGNYMSFNFLLRFKEFFNAIFEIRATDRWDRYYSALNCIHLKENNMCKV